MTIEFKCSHCSSILRVGDEHLGKQARCPKCQTLNRVQPEETAPVVAEVSPSHPTNLPDRFPEGEKNPFVSPHAPLGRTPNRRRQKPHRGTMILTLGILSIVCNVFLIPGIMAWVMGKNDLKEMKRGSMDRSGESITQVGMILGIIMTVLGGLGMVLYFFMLIFVVAAGPH